MNRRINEELARAIDAHAKRLRFLYRIKGFGYERAIELPLLAEQLKPLFDKPLRYLDIGTGQSIFPSWVAANSNWDVTCLDKFNWVEKQHEYAAKLGLDSSRYHVVLRDFLEAELEPESFDVIT
ncbi:MAG: class I SAM-dependent methyltransferase, partial [Candidatus Kapabacteria bacterium]|nr:class I SAM-dependent methyltransferase [Candidatus Kapabacteria bacterium]